MNKDNLDVFPLISICLDIADKVKTSYDTPDADFDKKFEENIVDLITKLCARFPPDHNNDVTETSKKKEEACETEKEKYTKIKDDLITAYNKKSKTNDEYATILKLKKEWDEIMKICNDVEFKTFDEEINFALVTMIDNK